MAENFNLIFGSQAPTTATWTDADYQTGWSTVGSTPPTAEQFDFLQNRADMKAKELNDALTPLVQKSEVDGRQAGTIYAAGAMLTVDGLPNGWLLQCIVPGISGTDAITLPGTLIDGLTIVDGTVTWALRKVATNGSLGYRQPSTAYSAGQIAYHASLPTGWYLECTTPGTSSSGELTITSPAVGDTVTDGTVTWKIGKSLSVNGGTMYANNINRSVDNAGILICGGTDMYKGSYVLITGKDNLNAGAWELSSSNGTNRFILRGNIGDAEGKILKFIPNMDTPSISYDLAGSAIVAKSLGAVGYIKYASGLIIQWGQTETRGQGNNPATFNINFPISFTNYLGALVPLFSTGDTSSFPIIKANGEMTLSSITLTTNGRSIGNVRWIAIGY